MKATFTIIFTFFYLTISGGSNDFCFSTDEDNDLYSIENSIPNVHLTVYHAVEEQCNKDWVHTADMTFLGTDVNTMYRHRIVAVSRDLLTEWGLSMGDTIEVRGLSVP